jgi:pimeloyl-ACP methyl ester carboxylesterase
MALIPADQPDSSRLGPKAAAAGAISTPQNRQTLYTSDTSSNLIVSDSPSHYSSFSSSDSDEPLPHSIEVTDEDAAGDVVGVSIGREQSRMKARATPLEEKTRALENHGSYFATIPDTVGEDGLFASELTAEPQSLAEPESEEPNVGKAPHERGLKHKPRTTYPSVRHTEPKQGLPHGPRSDLFAVTPGKPGPKDTAVSQRSGFVGSLLKNTLPRRPRAWSGEFRKFLPDLTSLKKRPSLSFRGPHGQNRNRSQTTAPAVKTNLGLPKRTVSLGRGRPPPPPTQSSFSNDDDAEAAQPISELRSPDETSAAKHSFTRRPSTAMAGRPPSLRRTSSDHSLYLRASSTASSLEQRPLYENIHSQVNSRFKAIKDSLQDSSSRLLSMPNLHLDIRPDWGSRPFLPDMGNGPISNGNGPSGVDNGEIPRQAASTPPPPRTNTNPMHPILEAAMADLTGDVVILGGYRGSILRSAKPPHRQLWVPMKVGLNLRKVDLEVGLNPEDEERMEETIIPSGVLSHVGPVDVCRRLMKRLRKSENALRGDMRVHDYGYDWRLSPELLSRRLIAFLENLQCNQEHAPGEPGRGATVIAHSLGGLITRHAVNERPDLFAGVLYAGVPQHCVNILGPLRNGDDVLISSRVLTAQVNFTFRTSFALLPEDGHCFIDKASKKEFRIDFFNAKTWDDHRLSPCIGPALPALPTITSSVSSLGLKDLPLIGKRFSMNPREDTEDPPTGDQYHFPTDGNSHSNTHHPVAATNKDITARNPPHDSPHNTAAYIAEKANPADGIIGPGTNPRSSAASKAATTSTIPRAAAMAYLQRTLDETKRFKANLAFRPDYHNENRYPPAAVLYGKTVPTVYGARVVSRETIKQVDAYDDLAFAAGDGVCLASAAMLPPGYRIIKDGLVKSERGHVGLLGDLEGVGQCLRALQRGRKEGVGLGEKEL